MTAAGDDPLFHQPLPSAEAAQAMVAAVQRWADSLQAVLRAPPPQPTTCCGRGCNGCVWESYYAALEHWRAHAKERLLGTGRQRA